MRNIAAVVGVTTLVAMLCCGEVANAQDSTQTCSGLVDQAGIDRCTQLLESGTLDGEALFGAAAWQASAKFTLGDYYGAAQDADIIANLWSGYPYGHAVGCLARAAEGRELETAERNCARALELSDEPSMFTMRGVLRLKQNRDREAWADFSVALQGDPGAQQALYGRGIAAMRMGRTSEGRADIDAAAEIDRQMLVADPNALTSAQMYTAWDLNLPQ